MRLEANGSAVTTPSLTIDILNKESMVDRTTSYFNGVLPPVLQPMDGERLRGDFRERSAIWGFRELSTMAARQSNGVALTGERLVIYIAPRGHAAGHLSGYADPIFARVTLIVTAYDLAHGTQASTAFNNFTSAADDPSRYLHLALPEYDSIAASFAASQGVHGSLVLALQETYEFFQKADFTDPLSDLTVVNESYTQIQTIYWKGVLSALTVTPNTNIELLTNCDFRKYNLPINTTVTPVSSVFDRNLAFKDFRRSTKIGGVLTPVDPTVEQKETIVRDGTMGLLSTQLPILPADASPSPVLSLGIASAPSVPAFSESVVARPAAGDLQNVTTRSRFFGLNGAPPAVNTLETLNALTNNHAQLSLTLRDPLRVLSCDCLGRGTVVFGWGTEAIGFAQLKEGSESLPFTIGEDFPVISDVRLTSIDLFDRYSIGATLSFRVSSGDAQITTVSFGLALRDENYVWFEDPTGVARSRTIHWSDLGEAATETDTIYGCVALRSHTGEVRFYKGFLCLAPRSDFPGVENVSVKQRADGSGKVEMAYDYVSAREIEVGSAAVLVNGSDPHAARDVGTILPGTHKLSWAGTQSASASLTITSGSANKRVNLGNFAFAPGPEAPYVTLNPSNDRFGVDDGDDPKDHDFELESIDTIESISSSLDSSTSLISHSWSSSSKSSKSSRSSPSSNPGPIYDCRFCDWSISCAVPSGRVLQNYSGQIVLHPSSAYCPGQSWLFSATGLPLGLYLNPLTGYIAGTPLQAGIYTVNINASDSLCGYSHGLSCNITIADQPDSSSSSSSPSSGLSTFCKKCDFTLAALSPVDVFVNQPYYGKVTLNPNFGCAHPDWLLPQFVLLSGALPPGLWLRTNGVIQGTPTALGSYNFTIRATDTVCNHHHNGTYSIDVVNQIDPLVFNTSDGTPYCASSSVVYPTRGPYIQAVKFVVAAALTIDDYVTITIDGVGSYDINTTTLSLYCGDSRKVITGAPPSLGSDLKVNGTGAVIVVPAGSTYHFTLYDTIGIQRRFIGTLNVVPV